LPFDFRFGLLLRLGSASDGMAGVYRADPPARQ